MGRQTVLNDERVRKGDWLVASWGGVASALDSGACRVNTAPAEDIPIQLLCLPTDVQAAHGNSTAACSPEQSGVKGLCPWASSNLSALFKISL